MTLVISEFRADGQDLFEGDLAFGFVRYRRDLWGTNAVQATGAVMIPKLRDSDLFVEPDELDSLQAETEVILDRREGIALAIFDSTLPGEGAVVRDAKLFDAFAGTAPADSIQRYCSNLLRCVETARRHKCGLVIW